MMEGKSAMDSGRLRGKGFLLSWAYSFYHFHKIS